MGETDYFLSQDGLRLFYQYWGCDNPKAMVCLVHGLGEHSERYHHFAQFLNENDICVFGMDLRGHGRSKGKRGHARNYPILLSDIEEMLKTARATHTELPMFLFGQSMGGNLVANYVIRMNTNELEGFILSAPWFKLAFEPPAWKVQLAKIVRKILPSITQPNNLDPKDFTHDQEVIDAYNNDPMIHRVISAGLYMDCVEAGEYALENVNRIQLRGLVLHGNDDPIIDWQASSQFAENHQDISWHELDGILHEPLNDSQRDYAMTIIRDWIFMS